MSCKCPNLLDVVAVKSMDTAGLEVTHMSREERGSGSMREVVATVAGDEQLINMLSSCLLVIKQWAARDVACYRPWSDHINMFSFDLSHATCFQFVRER